MDLIIITNFKEIIIITLFADFSKVKTDENNPKWEQAVLREDKIYLKENDLRSPFIRDIHRIMHSMGYRRLKSKTQVFYAPHNDHICTRIEHVNHVALVAEIIAKNLNLNADLARAIAVGHDIGHAPFGHHGEHVIKNLVKSHNLNPFWHERNSLYFTDNIETLPDYDGINRNLNLTYAVRDGIVCHCGEVDDKCLKTREDAVNLYSISQGSKESAYTYEGCVVKISDKIAYIGRDIEDALIYKILTEEQIDELLSAIQNTYPEIGISEINSTVLIHKFIEDLCKNSSPENGLCFSDACFNIMNFIKKFNYKNIYHHPRLNRFTKYATLVIETIFEKLCEYYPNVRNNIAKEYPMYPVLVKTFEEWLIKYSDYNLLKKSENRFENKVIYNISNETDFKNAIMSFISGMTDTFAIAVYNELISF